MVAGRPELRVAPAPPPLAIEVAADARWLRVALRGDGEVAVRLAAPVADVDVRGGFAWVVPGDPWLVRAPVAGRLSIIARLLPRA
jgi:hypothetical protein